MRPLYIDINGTTDAKGNASIPVALGRMTGRWHNAKFSLSTTAPAEWAILVNGRPYTYGRGRRVTLGPELIQDGQTATVSVIGGPVNATVDGTCTGKSGTPDEIMASFTPAPNTIALDTTLARVPLYPDGTPISQQGPAPSFPSFTVGANGNATKTFTLLPNQTAVRISQNGSTQFRLQVAGHQTTDGYLQSVEVLSSNFASANSPFRPIDIRVEPSWDPQIDITFGEDSGNPATVYVSALVGAETTVIAGATTQIPVFFLPTGAAVWQAAGLRPIRVAVALTAGTANAVLLRAGVAGQKIYMHRSTLSVDAAVAGGVASYSDGDPNAGGTSFDDFPTGAIGAQPHDYGGAPLTAGNGLFIWAQLMNFTIRGFVSVSQG